MDTGQLILIIEDEKKISEIVKAYLEKEGFRVTLAENGGEGLKALKENPDLVILDLMLPDIQGEELCSTIRGSSDVRCKALQPEGARGAGQGPSAQV
jgi:DNA-binding response OmpR family regulator